MRDVTSADLPCCLHLTCSSFLAASDAESVDEQVKVKPATASLTAPGATDVTAQRKRTQQPQARAKGQSQQQASPQRAADKKPPRVAAVTSPRDQRSRSRGSGSPTKQTATKDAKPPHRSVITFARNKLAPGASSKGDGGAGDAHPPATAVQNGEANNNNKMVNGFINDEAATSHSNGVTNAHSNGAELANGDVTEADAKVRKTDAAGLPQRAPRAPRSSHAKLAAGSEAAPAEKMTSAEAPVVNGDVAHE